GSSDVVGGERRCERWLPASDRRGERNGERDQQERESERPELGERLEIERMRLLRGLRHRAFLHPPVRERPRTGAEHRIRLRLAYRDAPVVGTVMTAQGERR